MLSKRLSLDSPNYHYDVMRRAIDLIDGLDSSVSLETLAAEMRMSSAHFQRIFSRWVGVSPKRYQQYLLLGHAKVLLLERFTTLDTAFATGLSGSGRLHDLFMKWEAMSPGDYAKQGLNLNIYWGLFDSRFGPVLVMGTDKGICGLGFTEEMGMQWVMQDLVGRWPKADFVEDPFRLQKWVKPIFSNGGLDTKAPPIHLMGAPFQIKVWEALMQIPSGYVTNYSAIAASIDNPKAVRAVGTAVGRNPVASLIPCHRVLQKSGGLGGYHWGLSTKRLLLAYESARFEA